jgi:hypothetical protein
VSEKKIASRYVWPGALWAIFAAGLLVQALAPRLEVENAAFVIPPSVTSGQEEVQIAELVETERRLQALSAVLTVSGALGLAFFYYRNSFRRTRAP